MVSKLNSKEEQAISWVLDAFSHHAIGFLTNSKGHGHFTSPTQDPMAAIPNDATERYDKSCMEIACHIVAEGAITKTRSGSTWGTIFYELDPRGHATLSRAYLSQRQKQRRQREQEW